MKTILYNPIFINPQAYYVFPQLYDIQAKTDDYTEQAIFAGRLLVRDLNNIDDVQIFQNTREINLSHFAGKSIQIEQQISDLRSYINSEVAKAKADLTALINQEIENRTNADNNLQSQINELKQLITNAQNAIDTHAARRDNPHVVTRAQLSLATTDSVVFNKVSAPSGFFKE